MKYGYFEKQAIQELVNLGKSLPESQDLVNVYFNHVWSNYLLADDMVGVAKMIIAHSILGFDLTRCAEVGL